MSLQSERELFEACVDLPKTARAQWLHEHCPDEASRERITRLLEAHDAAERDNALERRAHSPAERGERRIGPYKLLERVGEGAMGEVYLAEQVTPVVRRVALKVIKPGMDSREVIARFEVERQTLALMSHPSIAHIIDAGTTESGQPYFAMEYVAGIPLNRYCDQHRLSIDARLQLFLQICDAVQHAHQKGVIHRDLKPSNLLVSELDGRPMPKVIDFGIAKAVTPGTQASRAHTRIGHLIGTPEYMSPEQAQLSPLDVDTRSDVYSLGVVLHELLTGTLPFKIANHESSPAQLVHELLTFDPRAPSTRVKTSSQALANAAEYRQLTTRQLSLRLRGDLDWIVLRALQKDRNNRYGSPAELAADVRRHLANEPVVAGPPSVAYRMRKFAARHSLALALISGLFVSLAVFGVMMAYQAKEIAHQRDEARYQAQRAEASNEFMSLMLESVGPEGRALTPIELVDTGLELLNKQYGDDPRFVARMLLQMARRYMDLHNTNKQLEVLHRAENIARDLKDDELIAAVQCAAVVTELDANNYSEAERRMKLAREAMQRLGHTPVTTRVDCLRAEADIAHMHRDRAGAIASLKEGIALLERADDTRGLRYNGLLTDLGGIYYNTARYKEALELNILTSDALDRNGRGGTLAKATLMINRSSLLYRLGEIENARKVGEEAIQRIRSLRGAQPIPIAYGVSFGTTLQRLGRWDQALTVLEEASSQAKLLDSEFLRANAQHQLARALMGSKQFETVEAKLADAERIWMANETGNRDRLGDLLRTRAELAMARGDYDSARQFIDAALSKLSYAPGQDLSPGASAALTTASKIYLQLGDIDKSVASAREALALAERVARDPTGSADIGDALLALGHAQQAQRDPAATATLARANETLRKSLGRS
ncbi:serine/threonine-protein kinase [Peristeroidobacter agariperforans]|uniref:serine/threonine-protein kinase n=1 Tax=Peristeroidobacter agariperforans TaxID=268404 RepID=UPI00101E0124|nr:serine/threonine-protein kinase [Peristeroidobacter agariperforans]